MAKIDSLEGGPTRLWIDLDRDTMHVETCSCDGYRYAKWVSHALTIDYCEEKDGRPCPVGFQLRGFSKISRSSLDQVYDFLARHSFPASADLKSLLDGHKKRDSEKTNRQGEAR